MRQSFLDISKPMRDTAKRNVDQSRIAFDNFMEVLTGTMGIWTEGSLSNRNTRDFKAVEERTMAFAKQNAESTFALANDVTNASNFQEVVSLHSKYAQNQKQAYALQIKELGQLSAKALHNLRTAA